MPELMPIFYMNVSLGKFSHMNRILGLGGRVGMAIVERLRSWLTCRSCLALQLRFGGGIFYLCGSSPTMARNRASRSFRPALVLCAPHARRVADLHGFVVIARRLVP